MTYRDDLEAAHARTDALEQELAETRKRNAELEAENARTEVLAHEVAEMKKENVALQARLAPRIEITDLERAKYLADARRVLKLRLIATLVIIAGIIGCLYGLGGDRVGLPALGLVVCWFLFVMPGEWQRK